MRDPRFQQSAFFADQAQLRRRAEEISIPPDQIRSVEEALRRVWATLLTNKPGIASEEIASRCDYEFVRIDPKVGALAAAIQRVLGRAPRIDDDLDLRAALMVGQVIGECVASGTPSALEFDRAHCVLNGINLASHAIDEAFLEHLRRDTVQRDKWTSELAKLPSDVGSYIRPGDEELTEGLARDGYRRPIEAWRAFNGFLRVDDGTANRLHMLAALSSKMLFEALETVPSTSVQHILLDYLQLHQDRTLLLEGLTLLPPAYENGRWTRRVMPFLILDRIVEHATTLSEVVEDTERRAGGAAIVITSENHAPSPYLESLRKEELPQWFETAFATLVERSSDGQRLAIEFAVELVRRTSSSRGLGRKTIWNGAEVARDVLVEELVKRGVHGETIRDACRLTADGDPSFPEVPYLVLSAYVDHERRHPTDPNRVVGPTDPGGVWAWYEERLEAADDVISSHVNPYISIEQWVFLVLGSALNAISDPVSQWSSTWDRLYTQRESMRFNARGLAIDPSRHLLSVGRHALAIKQSHQIEDADRQLWQRLRTHAEQLFLGGLLRMQRETHEICTVFAFVPHVMGQQWGDAVCESKDLFLANDKICLVSAWLLVLNGANPRLVRTVFRDMGCDPVLAGRRFQKWLTETNQEDEEKIDIAAMLAKLDENHISTEQPGTPGTPVIDCDEIN